MSGTPRNPKVAKKLAKAAAKAAKKQGKGAPPAHPSGTQKAGPAAGRSPAERAADAAERQVMLHRWRVILGVIGAIIAVATLLVTLLLR